jgi:hypothetical protein
MVNRRKLDAFLVAFEPDVEIRPIGFAFDNPERYIGHGGMHQFFADWTAAMGWPRFTVDDRVDLGDRLLLRVTFSSRGRASGVEAPKHGMGFVAPFSTRGRIAAWEMYWDLDEALRSLGLSEWPA